MLIVNSAIFNSKQVEVNLRIEFIAHIGPVSDSYGRLLVMQRPRETTGTNCGLKNL